MGFIVISLKREYANPKRKLKLLLKNFGVNVLKLPKGGCVIHWTSGIGVSRLGMKLGKWSNVYRQAMYVQTVDLDNAGYEQAYEIIRKILELNCNEGVSSKPSATKGYHLTVFCLVPGCDLCRSVFDDQVRFDRDQERPPESRNLLWDNKTIVAPRVTASRRKPRLAGKNLRDTQKAGGLP